MVALVTGASSGIGYAFAKELAGRGYDLTLVARNRDRLIEAREKLVQQFGANVDMIVADLADRRDVAKLEKYLSENNIEVLVNNAGFGLNEPLLSTNTEIQERAMDVMATAVHILSSAAGRGMVERGSGRIINIGSVSAWIYKGNYSAIKRWVVSYTRALADELDGTGVSATVVCPSWAKTNLHASAGVKRPKLPNWAWVSPERVARDALVAAERGKVLCIPKWQWKIAVWFLGIAPAGFASSVSKKIRNSRKGR